MASLNFPANPSNNDPYVFVDDQGNSVHYRYVADKEAWYAEYPAGSGGNVVPEAPLTGEDYVRNDGEWIEANYFSGDYNDLTNQPVIPAPIPQVNADWDATSGVAEILNKPTIPEPIPPVPQVNSDWDATSGVAEILNKPTIPEPVPQVNSDWSATGGVEEILNKPAIPAAQIQSDWNQSNQADLDYIKNKPDLTIYAKTEDIPTDNSELINGAGYITAAEVPSSGIDAVVDDTTPQLGGDLDVNGKKITSVSGNVEVGAASAKLEVRGVDSTDGQLQLNCSLNSHGVTIKAPPHSQSATYDFILPSSVGTDGQLLSTDGTQLKWIDDAPSSSGFSAGTKMVFAQATPDTGWTIDTTNNDAALRIVSDSTGGTTGGSTGFTTAFKSHTISFSGSGGTSSDRQNATYTCNPASFSVTGTTDSYLASGSVSVGISNHSLSGGQNGSHDHRYISTTSAKTNVGGGTNYNLQSYLTTDSSGSGSGHSHSASATFYGSAHSHDLSFSRSVTPTVPIDYTHDHGSVSFSGSGTVDNAVKYTNVCIGVKS